MGPVIAIRTLVLALAATLALSTQAAQAAPQPSVSAASAVLIDAHDGRVLFAKDAERPRAIASTTKIITALVVLQETDLDEVVTASANAEAVGADDPLVTELELVAGEKLTVEQLLYGMLLPSANDAAVALAEHVGGTVQRFATMMDAAAKAAGAKNSRFTNPAGFDHPDHLSTASDLAVLAAKAMRSDVFRRIVATKSHQLPWQGHPEGRLITNRNALLGAYTGADGVKTGQTRASGKSLVASATRDSEWRIAVVLASSDPPADAAALFDHGFAGFRRFQISAKGTPWGLVTRGAGQTYAVMPTATKSVLVPSSEPDPEVSFDQSTETLVATTAAGDGVSVPARLTCLSNPSDCRAPVRLTIFERLLNLLGPLTR